MQGGAAAALAVPGGVFHVALCSRAPDIRQRRHEALKSIFQGAAQASGVTREGILSYVRDAAATTGDARRRSLVFRARVCALLADGRLEDCLRRGDAGRVEGGRPAQPAVLSGAPPGEEGEKRLELQEKLRRLGQEDKEVSAENRALVEERDELRRELGEVQRALRELMRELHQIANER